MITVKYSGGLGNYMFMYAAAHLLSIKHKMPIYSDPKGFPKYPLTRNVDVIEKKFDDDLLLVKNEDFLDCLNKSEINQNLILDGYFQKTSIINCYEDKIRKCFHTYQEPIDGTIIHYRLGDLLHLYNGEAVTKLKYFENCLDKIEDKNNIYITTDSSDHDNIKYLQDKYNARLVNMKSVPTMMFASRFKNKILSLGTFSWWIAYLGYQGNIYCPIKNEYIDWVGDIYTFNDWKYITSY